jgi:hypothetical protein
MFASNGSFEPGTEVEDGPLSDRQRQVLRPASWDEGESRQGGYRFGRDVKYGRAKYGAGRSAWHRINGYVKTLIAAIGDEAGQPGGWSCWRHHDDSRRLFHLGEAVTIG